MSASARSTARRRSRRPGRTQSARRPRYLSPRTTRHHSANPINQFDDTAERDNHCCHFQSCPHRTVPLFRLYAFAQSPYSARQSFLLIQRGCDAGNPSINGPNTLRHPMTYRYPHRHVKCLSFTVRLPNLVGPGIAVGVMLVRRRVLARVRRSFGSSVPIRGWDCRESVLFVLRYRRCVG